MSASTYFDYQASTPLDERVRDEMFRAYVFEGNPGSEDHIHGWEQARRVANARAAVAEFIGASPDEIVFTSGATESNNIGVLGAALGASTTRRRVLVSAIEHKSVLEAAFAAGRFGFSVELIPVNADGLVNPVELERLLDDQVAVVSIMAVNNEIGTIQPIELLGNIVHEFGGFYHVDAAQAGAALDIDAFKWGADALSLSSHKIYGPPGIGALFLSHDAPWRPRPLMFGGGQEGGLRPGTLPVALCVGFGKACSIMKDEGPSERERIAKLRDRLRVILSRVEPDLIVTCEDTPRHPGSLHVRIPNIDAADYILKRQPNMSVSTGSACTSGIIGPSHVCLAIGHTNQEASECIRFSVGRFTTDADLANLEQTLKLANVEMQRA